MLHSMYKRIRDYVTTIGTKSSLGNDKFLTDLESLFARQNPKFYGNAQTEADERIWYRDQVANRSHH